MKKTVLIMAMIAGVSFGGIPIQWDVKVGYDQRFNESSPVAYNITAMRGETLDLMPRYMSSGYPFSIASNADVRIYLREYGTTNSFTVSSTSGTVYTTSSQLGRVRAVLLPSDIPSAGTNQFFVGIESSGMVYRAYGKLTLLDSPGVIVSTNQIARGVFDSSMFTFSNSHLAPWLLLSDIGNYCGVQSVNGLTGIVTITAQSLGALTNIPPQDYTIITNSPWALRSSGTITNMTVADKLNFAITFADALTTGQIAWDSDWSTFRAGVGDGVTGQFFQESHIYAKNVSGQLVTNGMAVRFSGAVGNSGKLEFTLAKAEVGVRPATTLGIATHDIANGAFGKITWFGNVNELDTTGALYGETGWTNNMLVFLSTNTAGYLTKNEPQAPQPRICIGAVINRHANVGTILVRPTWGIRITEADDVDGTPLTASGQIMVWDQSRGVFDFTDNVGNYATTGALTSAIAAIPFPTTINDSQSASYFQTLENGTSTVWEITGPFTNFNVTLSDTFEETYANTRPYWTNNVWPFLDGYWSGNTYGPTFILAFDDGSFSSQWANGSFTGFPVLLEPSFGAAGTAIISQTVYYATNVYSQGATVSTVQTLSADIATQSNRIDNVNSNLNACYLSISNQLVLLPASLRPRASTVYGDFATTNTLGYAAFLATNPPYSEVLSGGVTNGQRMARFRYAPSDSIESSVSFSGWAASGSTPATNLLSLFAVISVFDANGASVASASGAVKMVGAQLANASNFTASVSFSGIVSNASVVVDVFSATNTTRACAVVSGATTPAALTVNLNPLRYLSLLHTDVSATPDPHDMYIKTNDTDAINLTGAAYVRVPNPASGMDAATADFVRSLIAVGNPYYSTTNIAHVAYDPTNAAFFSSLTIPPTSAATFNVPSNNAYVLSMTSPMRFTGTLRGPMTLELHTYLPTGLPVANYNMSIEPELYYTPDTNSPSLTLGDWAASRSQALVPGTTNVNTFTIPFDDREVTNAWVVVRLKTTSKGSAANSITLLSGTEQASFALFRTVNTESLSTRGATNITFAAGCSVPTNAVFNDVTRTFTFSGYTLPLPGNTELTLDGTNLTVTGATYAYRATVTNAYRLNISDYAPAFHYGLTIIGTNAVTFADNLLLRGTATVTGTNCVAFQPWTNGTWEVLWGGK